MAAAVAGSRYIHTSKYTMLRMSGGADDDTKAAPFTTWSFDAPCETMEFSPLHPATVQLADENALVTDDADLVIVGVYAPPENDGETSSAVELTGAAKALDEELGGVLSEVLLEDKKYKAKAGAATAVTRVVTVGSDGAKKTTKFALVGLGAADKISDVSSGAASKIGTAIATACGSQKGVSTCTVVLPSSVSLSEVSCSFYSELYADNRFRTGDKIKTPAEDLTSVSIVLEDSDNTATSTIEEGVKLAKGIYLTKDIVNSPHNVLNSLSLASSAVKLAEESGGTIQTTILDKDECEKRGMGAFLGVARGSETEPKFIHMKYTPKSGEVKRKIGIVGKGLLFDTGGYNIKTAMMELMKFDCGGSAAVFGAARAIAALAPEGVEVHFCVAACENMISSKSYVPSDILTASNGKTIEVLNTDAEGRLTLADALVFADEELGCDKIVELSTLTGACMVALGKGLSGVFTKDDDLAKQIADASEATGDKSWRMPMPDEYNELLESKIADIQNIGTRYGGAITAALFLQNFVSKDKPFAHVDIAGPVWDDASGATGYGAKLVTELIVQESKQ